MKNTQIGQYSMMMFLIISLLVSSCTSHRAVEANNLNIQFHIRPGDKVRVVTKDNKETEFVVTEVTDEAIVGENYDVKFSDIAKLEEVNTANWGMILLVAVFSVVYVGAGFACAATGGRCSSGMWY